MDNIFVEQIINSLKEEIEESKLKLFLLRK